jgi:hypothetical protein
MIIKGKELEIDAARLVTVSDYAKELGVAYTTINSRIAARKLETIVLGNVIFVIKPEDKGGK